MYMCAFTVCTCVHVCLYAGVTALVGVGTQHVYCGTASICSSCLWYREDPECVDLSFATISSSGPNGAVIHYRWVYVECMVK